LSELERQMAPDLPPNLAGTPPYSEMRYAEEQAKVRKREEDERKRVIEAETRIKNQQTQQNK
jgi:hypothetical protein